MKAIALPIAQLAYSAGILGLLAGCAATPLGPTVQVMPGPGKSFKSFEVDQSSCKTYAAGQVQGQADAANQRAAGTAVVGTLLGAGLGAAIGGATGHAGQGAAIGAATGAGTGTAFGANNSSYDQLSIQAQYDNAYSQCMFAKGDQVPGFTPVAVAYAPEPGPIAVADPTVRAAQVELIRLGYYKGTADGFMGPRTRTAISSFEQANGLPVDGSASGRLVAKLQSTPTGSSVATTSPAPSSSGWVAPNSPSGSAPVTASAPPASNWVAPAKTP